MPLYCRVSLIFYRTTEAIWAKDLPETKDLLYEDCSVFTLVEKLKARELCRAVYSLMEMIYHILSIFVNTRLILSAGRCLLLFFIGCSPCDLLLLGKFGRIRIKVL